MGMNTPLKTLSRFWKPDKGAHVTILIFVLPGYGRRISVRVYALTDAVRFP